MFFFATLYFTSVLLIRGTSAGNVRIARSAGCTGTLTEPQGSITSPNFPYDYPKNILCGWLIRIKPGLRLNISFTNFRLEEDKGRCSYDFLQIHDGPSDAAPLFGKFCGFDLVPMTFQSNSSEVFIRFRTDGGKEYSGFKLYYSTICDVVYTGLSGGLNSPYYPDEHPANLDCVYEIRLPPGYLVELRIHNIDIEPHENCKFDYLEIRDGNSENSHQVARLCGDIPPKAIISSYNFLWLKFKTDDNLQKLGFLAKYDSIKIGCGRLVTENNSRIASPGRQEIDTYPFTCKWLIHAPKGHIIQLSFSTFVLQHGINCFHDYVLIEATGNIKIGKFCGEEKPPIITSLDNNLILQFSADAIIDGYGFVADYQFLDASKACGGHVYQESGIIRSPGYPDQYLDAADCVWILHSGNSNRITLNVTYFSLRYHADCEQEFLEIRDGDNETSPLIGKFCGIHVLREIQSSNKSLWLKFITNSSSLEDGSESSSSHGDVFENPNTINSSPRFEIYFAECKCGEGHTCLVLHGTVKCLCRENFWEIDGICIKCFCGDGHICQIVGGEQVCVCMDNYQNNNGTCEECDCGSGHSCHFQKGRKICKSLQVDTDSNKNREECSCGDGHSCGIIGGRKICVCKDMYQDNNGTCQECDCGSGNSCKFYEGRKGCTFSEIHITKKDMLEECSCGDGHSCGIIGGRKVCFCRGIYQENNGTCQECDCGSGNSCKFHDGKKTCTFSQNHIENKGMFEECDCGSGNSCEFLNGRKTCIISQNNAENKGIFEGVITLIILTSTQSTIILFLMVFIGICTLRLRRRLLGYGKAGSHHRLEEVSSLIPQDKETIM